MYHHCHDAAHKKYPYLGGGCARGPNAKHHQSFVFPLDDVKEECHACHNLVHPPLLWVCENKRWEPSVRGVCVQCAAILMIEDQDGPNIVVQNSHTVLVTSLFCVKIAHELRAVYAGVYASNAELVIALEAKVGDQFVDAFLGIENVVAVFVENTMSESKPNRVNDVDRVKSFIEDEKQIQIADGFLFNTRRCKAIFGTVLQLDTAKNFDYGKVVLYYIAQGHAAPPLLPSIPMTQRPQKTYKPLVETNLSSMQLELKEIKVLITLSAKLNSLITAWMYYPARKRIHAKFEVSRPNSRTGALFLKPSPDLECSSMCLLCGVPIKIENEPSALTLLESVKDNKNQLRAQTLVARGIKVRQDFTTCLTCSEVFLKKQSLGAFHSRIHLSASIPIVARQYLKVKRHFVRITERYGKRLEFNLVLKQAQDTSQSHRASKPRHMLMNDQQKNKLMHALHPCIQKPFDSININNFPMLQLFQTPGGITLVTQLAFYYELTQNNPPYKVYVLSDDIRDAKTCILARPKLNKHVKILCYTVIGNLPRTNLSSSEEFEFLSLHQMSMDEPRSLCTVQKWRILGLSAFRMLNMQEDVDLFLHHVWDPFMLDELERLGKEKTKFCWLTLPHSTGDRGTRLAQAPPLAQKEESNTFKCGQRAYVDGGGDFICVYASCVKMWAFCCNNKNCGISFDVILRVLYQDIFQWQRQTMTERILQFKGMPKNRTREGMLATERELQNIRKSEQFPRGDLGLAAHAAARVVGDHARAAGFEALRTHEWLRSVALG